MLADTTDIASQVIECNKDEDDNKSEEDTIKEDRDGNVEVSVLLMIDLPVHDLFYIYLL